MPRTTGVTNSAPYAQAPPVGAPGDTYFNVNSKVLYVSDGSSWIAIAGTPTGTIQAYGGVVAPQNWLLCDGTAYIRANYAALFQAIGTRFGAGDGSTTFNVPNLRGVMVVGADGSSDFPSVGAAGGVRTRALGTNELPNHNHGGQTGYTGASDRSLAHQHSANWTSGADDRDHNHGDYYGGWDYVIQTGSGGGSLGFGMVGGDRNISQVSATGGRNTGHLHAVSGWTDGGQGAPDHLHGPSGISAQGNGAAFGVLNPYVTVTFIIKT